mmetsp:Transcript_26721/g.80678  ORF Transcript_26721/g.80678 Transcript_26721/m.80678 type:complete len:111 (-) Transcript_26721:1377-1709(-)
MMLLSVGPRRVIRNPTFSNQCNAIATGREEEAELLRLDALQAITGNDRTCVLGSLVQLEDGMLALEDPHAVVKVDTSRALTFGGFFAEGMVVLPLLTGYHQNHFLTGRDS